MPLTTEDEPDFLGGGEGPWECDIDIADLEAEDKGGCTPLIEATCHGEVAVGKCP